MWTCSFALNIVLEDIAKWFDEGGGDMTESSQREDVTYVCGVFEDFRPACVSSNSLLASVCSRSLNKTNCREFKPS